MQFLQSLSLRQIAILFFILLIVAAFVVRGLERLESYVDGLFCGWEMRNRHITSRQLNRDRWASNYRSPALRDFK